MNTYIMFYKNVDIGGCELLIGKIGRQLIKEQNEVWLCCSEISEEMKLRYLQDGIQIHFINNWGNTKEIKTWLLSFHKMLFEFTFIWDDYIRMYSLRGITAKTVFYAVHYKALAIGRNCRIGIINFMLKKILLPEIRRYAQERKIVCMDEQTVHYTKDYYNKCIRGDNISFEIIRIPVDGIHIKECSLNKSTKSKGFGILAIARADFPFKGYLLGLIDYMNGSDVKPDINLTIISYGKDLALLHKKMNAASPDVKKRIELIGKVDYEELENYFLKSKLYIGMGTTLLDASLRNVIAVPVASYTNDLKADSFFYEDITRLTADGLKVNKIVHLINTVYDMSEKEYAELADLSKKMVENTYGTPIIVKQFMELFQEIEPNNCKGHSLMVTYGSIFKCMIKQWRMNR